METANAISASSLQYYVIARCWASDLEFVKIETVFLRRLLDEYFIRLASKPHIDKLRPACAKLLQLEKDETQIDNLLSYQIKHLELMSEDITPEDAEPIADTQIKLEHLTVNLSREFREVKKELFALVEGVMRETRHLLN